MVAPSPPIRASWTQALESAWRIFDDLEDTGFGAPAFSLDGGTVLMFEFQHRLSKDIAFFGHDAQWLSLISPRLNETAAAIAANYVEQANTVKIVMPHGDIDFIVSADVLHPVARQPATLLGREIEIDPPAEILAKKLMYRASAFKPRDVYDLSAAIDLTPAAAQVAVDATRTQHDLLLRRLSHLRALDPAELTRDIVPYDGPLRHADRMIDKVIAFIEGRASSAGD